MYIISFLSNLILKSLINERPPMEIFIIVSKWQNVEKCYGLLGITMLSMVATLWLQHYNFPIITSNKWQLFIITILTFRCVEKNNHFQINMEVSWTNVFLNYLHERFGQTTILLFYSRKGFIVILLSCVNCTNSRII